MLHPRTPAEIADIVREASSTGTRLLVVGGRTHIDRGNPSPIDAELWTTQLDGVVAYEPAEMLAVVQAGLRCDALGALLAEHGQEWPVDAPGQSTVGGVIAAGASSYRRLRVGHIRDTVVEMQVVTGDGRIVKSGARTVKNVTGYDVHRLMTGSLGTLGVITQVALKVRPLPRARRWLRADGGLELAERLVDAVPQAGAILASPETVTLAAEGWPEEVSQQEAAAETTVPMAEIPPGDPPPTFEARTIVEIAVPPSALPTVLADTRTWQAQIGTGIAWAGVDGEEALHELRTRVSAVGGIAPASVGPGGLGDAPVPAMDVHRRLKASFDPAGVLAPGRGWGGI
jgi:glycolate dehydrogenase FAD-binding subunit